MGWAARLSKLRRELAEAEREAAKPTKLKRKPRRKKEM